MAVARGYRRTARLRLNDLVTPCFHRFTACGAMPPHLALQFGRRTIPYHSVQRLCAAQQIQQADVRFGSKAEVKTFYFDVRFTPKSGHGNSVPRCPLCAKSGHTTNYSITSSARASTEGGIVMPSVLAVLRLITSSYLVGDCTGRSAGFSPLRMRST